MGELTTDPHRRCTWPACTSSYLVKYGPVVHGWKFGPLGWRLCPLHSDTAHKPNLEPVRAPRGLAGMRLRCGCGHSGEDPHRHIRDLLTEWADHVLNREGT